MKTQFQILLWLGALLLAGCAQVVSPTGGPKDEQAPKIVASNPLNQSTNFSTNKILLEFDEFIKLTNITQQMVISPPMATDPEMKLKGRKLEIIFQDTLLPNTTYTINFGEGIQDVNENNPLDSNTFVFSTGDYLDSLSVTGVVKNAFDLTTEENLLVLLYDRFEDSIPRTQRPLYMARTQENGRFILENLKADTFQIFVLKDANSNFKFDLPNEAIAFRKETFETGGNDTFKLMLFEEDTEIQYLKSAKSLQFRKLQFLFNRPVVAPSIIPLSPSVEEPWFTEELYSNNDTLVYWLKGMDAVDTLELKIIENDSILDTVQIKLSPRKKESKKNEVGDKNFPSLELRPNLSGGKQHFFQPLNMVSNNPFRSVQKGGWTLIEGNDTLILDSTQLQVDFRGITLDRPWLQETSYQLILPPDVITDFYGQNNDTLRIPFKTRTIEDYGTLELKVQVEDQGFTYLVQLLGEKGNFIRQDTLPTDHLLSYKHLMPKKYRLKIVLDENGNGKWDTGEFASKTQPEKVLFHQELVEIRANWDLTLDWIIQ